MNPETPFLSDDSVLTSRKRKTYENRRHDSSSTSVPPDLNCSTSRYGRTLRPKITEDFYNIEDIFVPYEKITALKSPKKKAKLDLTPPKDQSINLEINKDVMNTVISLDIPDDSMDVSQVLKLVANNSSEFSLHSPPFHPKPIKTYGNKNKRIVNSSTDKFPVPVCDPTHVNGVSVKVPKEHEQSDCDHKFKNHVESSNFFSEQTALTSSCSNKDPFSEINNCLDLNLVRVNNSVKSTVEENPNINKNVVNSDVNESCIIDENEPLDVLLKRVQSETKRTEKTTSNSTKSSKKASKKINKNKPKLKTSTENLAESQSEIVESDGDKPIKIKKKVKKSNDYRSKRLHKKKITLKKFPVSHNKILLNDILKEKWNDDDIKIKHEIKEEDESKYEVDFNYVAGIGDLAWTRVGSYPFWPSIITKEPGHDRYMKRTMYGRRAETQYHVNFFGDNGRRSWVLGTHLLPFRRRTDVQEIAKCVSLKSKPKDPQHITAFIIHPNKLKKWKNAVMEAEALTELTAEQRIKKFNEMISPKSAKKRKISQSKSPKAEHGQKKIKLERRSITPKKFKKKLNSVHPETSEIKNQKKLKTLAKTNKTKLLNKILKEPVSVKQEIDNKPKIKKGRSVKNDLRKTESSEEILELDKIKIEKTEKLDTPSPASSQSFASRMKKNNIFKGVTKDRVCQICHKPKKVFKCKGNCFGLYHLECDKKIYAQLQAKYNSNNGSLNVTDVADTSLNGQFKGKTTIVKTVNKYDVSSDVVTKKLKSKTKDIKSKTTSMKLNNTHGTQSDVSVSGSESIPSADTTEQPKELDDLNNTLSSSPKFTQNNIKANNETLVPKDLSKHDESAPVEEEIEKQPKTEEESVPNSDHKMVIEENKKLPNNTNNECMEICKNQRIPDTIDGILSKEKDNGNYSCTRKAKQNDISEKSNQKELEFEEREDIVSSQLNKFNLGLLEENSSNFDNKTKTINTTEEENMVIEKNKSIKLGLQKEQLKRTTGTSKNINCNENVNDSPKILDINKPSICVDVKETDIFPLENLLINIPLDEDIIKNKIANVNRNDTSLNISTETKPGRVQNKQSICIYDENTVIFPVENMEINIPLDEEIIKNKIVNENRDDLSLNISNETESDLVQNNAVLEIDQKNNLINLEHQYCVRIQVTDEPRETEKAIVENEENNQDLASSSTVVSETRDNKQELIEDIAMDNQRIEINSIQHTVVNENVNEMYMNNNITLSSNNNNRISEEMGAGVGEIDGETQLDVSENCSDERKLSLGEKIDLKLAEVMEDLIKVTKYYDSTDEDSDKDSDWTKTSENTLISEQVSVNSDEMIDQFGEGLCLPSRFNKKIIKHVTADGVYDVIEEERTEKRDLKNMDFKCAYCRCGVTPPCFVCGREVSKAGVVTKHRCLTAQCGKYYHAECLREWPQTKWRTVTRGKSVSDENLCCPYHSCHTCISDDPRGPLTRYTNEKLAKCIKCPTTYHISNYCVPAGTQILSTYQIICPKHCGRTTGRKYMPHVNASWCFICSIGGSLICCETCPSSFHVECLKLVPPEGKYLCEECESGRLPLFGEVVWVKLGSYRWWPAQILFPIEIPEKVKNIPHNKGEFVVRFFGTHDHYWVNRGRVFIFQEGDTGNASTRKTSFNGLFMVAVQEAKDAHKFFVEERENRAAGQRIGMKPPSYIKIKFNRPVGDVRSADFDTSNTTPCECDPNSEAPCGPDSDCLNRILLTECNPLVCVAGTRCCNQNFEKRLYMPMEPFKTNGRGWGLKALKPIRKGSFVIEYVGEVINENEYHRRMTRKHEQKDENYYFLTIDKDRMIDAGPKGNEARFMNHSCTPNCETQKWTVNGDTRVGLFAITDIPAGAELTFNYNLECIGEERKVCRCGAPNCSGFIGVKAKQDENGKKKKSISKPKKKKSAETKIVEVKTEETDLCSECGKPGAFQTCAISSCKKIFHLHCVHLKKPPESNWSCLAHTCNCNKLAGLTCVLCASSSSTKLHPTRKTSQAATKRLIGLKHNLRNNKLTEEKLKKPEISYTSRDLRSQNRSKIKNETQLAHVKRNKSSKRKVKANTPGITSTRKRTKRMQTNMDETNKNKTAETPDNIAQTKREMKPKTITKQKKREKIKKDENVYEVLDESSSLANTSPNTNESTAQKVTQEVEEMDTENSAEKPDEVTSEDNTIVNSFETVDERMEINVDTNDEIETVKEVAIISDKTELMYKDSKSVRKEDDDLDGIKAQKNEKEKQIMHHKVVTVEEDNKIAEPQSDFVDKKLEEDQNQIAALNTPDLNTLDTNLQEILINKCVLQEPEQPKTSRSSPVDVSQTQKSLEAQNTSLTNIESPTKLLTDISESPQSDNQVLSDRGNSKTLSKKRKSKLSLRRSPSEEKEGKLRKSMRNDSSSDEESQPLIKLLKDKDDKTTSENKLEDTSTETDTMEEKESIETTPNVTKPKKYQLSLKKLPEDVNEEMETSSGDIEPAQIQKKKPKKETNSPKMTRSKLNLLKLQTKSVANVEDFYYKMDKNKVRNKRSNLLKSADDGQTFKSDKNVHEGSSRQDKVLKQVKLIKKEDKLVKKGVKLTKKTNQIPKQDEKVTKRNEKSFKKEDDEITGIEKVIKMNEKPSKKDDKLPRKTGNTVTKDEKLIKRDEKSLKKDNKTSEEKGVAVKYTRSDNKYGQKKEERGLEKFYRSRELKQRSVEKSVRKSIGRIVKRRAKSAEGTFDKSKEMGETEISRPKSAETTTACNEETLVDNSELSFIKVDEPKKHRLSLRQRSNTPETSIPSKEHDQKPGPSKLIKKIKAHIAIRKSSRIKPDTTENKHKNTRTCKPTDEILVSPKPGPSNSKPENRNTDSPTATGTDHIKERNIKHGSKVKNLKLGMRKSMRFNKSASDPEDPDDINGKREAHKQLKLLPNLPEKSFSSTSESQTDSETSTDETTSSKTHKLVETLKRKRQDSETSDSDVKIVPSLTEIVKRKRGRPRKHESKETAVKNVEKITALYKRKFSNECMHKYENNIPDIKLNPTIPERHLRVVLRKNTEIDTRNDNRFLQMQNDLERDLPIRKRSKLRLEVQ